MQRIRQQYLSALSKAYAALKSQAPTAVSELCLQLNKRATHDVLRLYVVDLAVPASKGRELQLSEVNVDPIAVQVPGIKVGAAVAWNGIEFLCAPQVIENESILAWAAKWIDDASPPLGKQDGFNGIIHSITQPTVVNGHCKFSVDFGSAPIEAFRELTAIVGAQLLEIGSYALSP